MEHAVALTKAVTEGAGSEEGGAGCGTKGSPSSEGAGGEEPGTQGEVRSAVTETEEDMKDYTTSSNTDQAPM